MKKMNANVQQMCISNRSVDKMVCGHLSSMFLNDSMHEKWTSRIFGKYLTFLLTV